MTRSFISLLVLLTAASASAQQTPNSTIRRAVPPPQLALPSASDEQLAAAAMTYYGGYACEFKQSLQVSRSPRFEGYVVVRFGKQLYTMKPIVAETGALRLEDVRGRLLLLQIANKSMLLDVQTGRRLVDECIHERQAEQRRATGTAPP